MGSDLVPGTMCIVDCTIMLCAVTSTPSQVSGGGGGIPGALRSILRYSATSGCSLPGTSQHSTSDPSRPLSSAPPAPPECTWSGHLAGAGLALRCWLCSASADVTMGHVYGARSVAVLVVLRLCVCDNRDGWLVAWGLCGCMLSCFSTVWFLPFTLL